MFDRILVPLDESEYSERALVPAQDLAKATGASVTLIGVLLRPTSVHVTAVPKLDEQSRLRLKQYLDGHAEAVRQAGIEHVTTEVRFGEAAGSIADLAREEQMDLIVMSTHGLGASGRYALGSVALKVLMTAPCPVFLQRIPEQAPVLV